MSRIHGTIASLLALVALLAPLPVIHYGACESLHVEAVALQGEAAHTCDCDDHKQETPNRVQSNPQPKQPLWFSVSPTITVAAMHDVHGFTPPTVEPAHGFVPVSCADIRGPPRSILALFCTLRV